MTGEQKKIIIGEDGVSLEEITKGCILLFSNGRLLSLNGTEELVTRIDSEKRIVYTERRRNLSKVVIITEQVSYEVPSGERLHPKTYGNVFNYNKINTMEQR